MTAAAHRVVVVEDHPIFRSGLAQCLDAEPDFEVVGQWADGSVAVDDLSALDPDIVLMDIELPGASGIEVTRRIRQSRPDLRVVILTAFADANLLFAAMQSGAVGYMLKHTPAPELVATLRRIADGEHVLSPDLASRFLEEFRARQTRPRPVPLDQLSVREEEVLAAVHALLHHEGARRRPRARAGARAGAGARRRGDLAAGGARRRLRPHPAAGARTTGLAHRHFPKRFRVW